MTIITRAEWGAVATTRTVKIGALPELFIHHVAGRRTTGVDDEMRHMRELQAYAINTKHYQDIDYNLIVGPSGNIYEARGLGHKSAATLDRNDLSRSICAMGNYDRDAPTDELLDGIIIAGRMMIDAGDLGRGVVIRGHRDNPSHPGATACPGRYLYTLVDALAHNITNPQPLLEDDDMNTARRVKHPAYTNVWLVGAGPALNLAGELNDSYADVPLIITSHPLLLRGMLAQSGLTTADLEAV